MFILCSWYYDLDNEVFGPAAAFRQYHHYYYTTDWLPVNVLIIKISWFFGELFKIKKERAFSETNVREEIKGRTSNCKLAHVVETFVPGPLNESRETRLRAAQCLVVTQCRSPRTVSIFFLVVRQSRQIYAASSRSSKFLNFTCRKKFSQHAQCCWSRGEFAVKVVHRVTH